MTYKDELNRRIEELEIELTQYKLLNDSIKNKLRNSNDPDVVNQARKDYKESKRVIGQINRALKQNKNSLKRLKE